MAAAAGFLIIFDCDGVLIDSEIIVAKAHANALAALACPVTFDDLIHRFTGVPDREMYAVIEAEWGQALPADYDQSVKGAVAASYRRDLRAVDGIHHVLGRLTSPVCVASSSSLEKLKLGLSLTGLHEHFAPHIFSADQVARGKPAPDLFLFAAEKMGFDPADCIVVEDSAAGVQAARAAKMPVIGFTGASHCPPRHGERLQREGAAVVLSDIRNLPTAIEAVSLRSQVAAERANQQR